MAQHIINKMIGISFAFFAAIGVFAVAEKANAWGAIILRGDGSYFSVANYATETAASDAAIATCDSASGSGSCSAPGVTTFNSQIAAYIGDTTPANASHGIGATPAEARTNAINACLAIYPTATTNCTNAYEIGNGSAGGDFCADTFARPALLVTGSPTHPDECTDTGNHNRESQCTSMSEVLDSDANICETCAAADSATPVFDTTATGNCRAATSDAECAAAFPTTPVYDGSMCVALPMNNAECAAEDMTMPIFDSSESDNCRAPRTNQECASVDLDAPFYDRGTSMCRVENSASECNANFDMAATGRNRCTETCPPERSITAQAIVGGSICTATLPTDCSATQTYENGMCRATAETDCSVAQTFADGMCRATTAADCDSDTERFMTDRCRATVAEDCIGEQTFTNGVCTDPNCGQGESVVNGICVADMLDCVEGEETERTIDGRQYCVAAFSSYRSSEYTEESCTANEWDVSYAVDSSGADASFAELCDVPVVRVAAGGGTGSSFLQVAEGQEVDSCVMAEEAGYVLGTAVYCDDAELFGGEGFVAKPAGFGVDSRLSVEVVAGGENLFFYGSATAPLARNAAPPPSPSPGDGADSGGKDEGGLEFGSFVGFGAAGILAILVMQSYSDPEAFSYSPRIGYSITESGYSANIGGRLDFQRDEWSLFWTGGQTNANGNFGDFRYAGGGEYRTDFWSVSFSESVSGETADYDLALSADWTDGIWSVLPAYRFHSRLEEGETETRNSLNLEGILEWNRWTIRQSAGFQWRRAEEFGDNARFRVEAVREF